MLHIIEDIFQTNQNWPDKKPQTQVSYYILKSI